MDMPKLGAAHKAMLALVGDWAGEETMHPSPWMPKGGKRKAKIANRLALGGFAVVQDYEQLGEGGMPGFLGHGVVTYDGAKDEYVMSWFDMFAPSEFRGKFKDGSWVLTARSPMGWHRATWTIAGDAYSFRMEGSQDGRDWSPMMDGAYKRRAVRKGAGAAKTKAAPPPKDAEIAGRSKTAAKVAAKPAAAKKAKRA